MVAKAVLAVQDLPLEVLEQSLKQSLKLALVQTCIELHAMAAKAALVTPEMLQPIRLAVQAALLTLIYIVVNIIILCSL